MILNLVVNARDAMPDGGRLTIETQNAHLDDRYAAGQRRRSPPASMSCSPSPTPDPACRKTSSPRRSTPSSPQKRWARGRGLGLSQVYGFIKQSGGHVKIYSEPGHGTTIKIYAFYPRLDARGRRRSPAAQPSARPRQPARETARPSWWWRTNPASAPSRSEALGRARLRLSSRRGLRAPAALRILDAHPEIDLLFTDVVMPDMNGRKLADEARSRRPDLKVLFTTGYTRNAVVHNGVLDREVALIGKPFTLDALGEKVRTVLGAT